MIKIHFLGTCSGTEPFPDMHHCSLVIEVNGTNYWFDAGENCAHSAHTSGINVLNTIAVFVSHPHLDHIGGMANLLGCMAKLCGRGKVPLAHNNTLQVSFPELKVFDAIKTVCCGSEIHEFPFIIEEHEVSDGLLYGDENVQIFARHNCHLKEDGSNGWHSYSFLIIADGKRIVFSGDVAKPEELDELVGDGCNALIMETGHHKVTDVCDYAISRNVHQLYFNHHGREIINNRLACEAIISEKSNRSGTYIERCCDRMVRSVEGIPEMKGEEK